MTKKTFEPCRVLKECTGNLLKELPLSVNAMEEEKLKKEAKMVFSIIKSTRQKGYALPAFYKPVSQIL
ncbi:MAG TPA: hypothetical protein VGD65_07680 [Chryseosolibacter sp.]